MLPLMVSCACEHLPSTVSPGLTDSFSVVKALLCGAQEMSMTGCHVGPTASPTFWLTMCRQCC